MPYAPASNSHLLRNCVANKNHSHYDADPADVNTDDPMAEAARATTAREQKESGLLAQALAPMALDQRRGLPDRHAAVQRHRLHAEPCRLDWRVSRRSRPRRARPARALLQSLQDLAADESRANGNLPPRRHAMAARTALRATDDARPNGRTTRSTCRCPGPAAMPG